jgi:glycosyltransferase involved in cell wall biosynthesis
MSAGPLPEPERRSLLWILYLMPGPNGAILRYLNFSKRLREAGFSVHFAISEGSSGQGEELVQEGCINGFSKLSPYRASGFRNALSRFLIFPGLRNRFMTRSQAGVHQEILSLVSRLNADVCIVSNRDYLMCISALTPVTRVVIDWCDSHVLFYSRSLLQSIRSGAWREVPRAIHSAVISLLSESYYPALAHGNVVVSPRDGKTIRRICPGARDLRVVLNGCEAGNSCAKPMMVMDRLIFSGRMDFPPNYEGAIWFIDHVMPLVQRRRPGVHLVIAGADPVDKLKARQSRAVYVTGFVPDMLTELAQASLYVAPLVSGGGFKNKIFEAILAGTPIVGTPLAVEFLPEELRSAVLVGKDAAGFADAVVRCLENPEPLAEEIKRAQQLLMLQFNWRARTADLLSVLNGSGI